jgi:hypothetical protein
MRRRPKGLVGTDTRAGLARAVDGARPVPIGAHVRLAGSDPAVSFKETPWPDLVPAFPGSTGGIAAGGAAAGIQPADRLVVARRGPGRRHAGGRAREPELNHSSVLPVVPERHGTLSVSPSLSRSPCFWRLSAQPCGEGVSQSRRYGGIGECGRRCEPPRIPPAAMGPARRGVGGGAAGGHGARLPFPTGMPLYAAVSPSSART